MYVSCDYGCSKSTEMLYRCVQQDFEGKTIIHVGDNKHSDINCAKNVEMETYYYKNVHEIGNPYRADGMSDLVGSAYAGIVNTHLHNGTKVYSPYYEYGFIYVLEFPPCQPRRVEFTPACFITGQEVPYPLRDGKLPLRHDMFDEDAIVLKGIPGRVTLKSPAGNRGVTLKAPDFLIFGFWHAPGTEAPYICLEPWSSLPSRQDVIEDLEKQPDLIALPAGKTYRTTWSLEFF